MIDTHCHLYDTAFDADREQALQRAVDAGVSLMLLPAIDSASTAALDALHASHPDRTRRMAGLHPTSVNDNWESELALVARQLGIDGSPAPRDYVAVGEIGMDLYWDRTFEAQQAEVLERQLRWAISLDLPVALHIRKAHNKVFSLLRKINRPSYRGVMHCFGGSVQEAHRAVEMGFMLGIGGVVTFKNATLADVVRAVPLESLLLETDAPYLAPVPHRGQRNESAFLPLVADKIAALRDISPELVDRQTSANAENLFRLAQ